MLQCPLFSFALLSTSVRAERYWRCARRPRSPHSPARLECRPFPRKTPRSLPLAPAACHGFTRAKFETRGDRKSQRTAACPPSPPPGSQGRPTVGGGGAPSPWSPPGPPRGRRARVPHADPSAQHMLSAPTVRELQSNFPSPAEQRPALGGHEDIRTILGGASAISCPCTCRGKRGEVWNCQFYRPQVVQVPWAAQNILEKTPVPQGAKASCSLSPRIPTRSCLEIIWLPDRVGCMISIG